MRRAVAAGVLAALLLAGCSLIGLYDGACCAFAPPGPAWDANAPLVIYDVHGQRAGTAIRSPSGGAILYTPSGASAGTVR